MRKVDFSNIIKEGNRTNWESNIGALLPYVYDEYHGEFKIIGYNKKTRKLKIINTLTNGEFDIAPSHLKECKIKNALGLINNDFKYNIGDSIETNLGRAVIIDRAFESMKKYYTCDINGQIKRFAESYIFSNRIRRNCGGAICIKGINDIATTHPELMKYFSNIEDTYKYSYASNKKVEMKCPNCGESKVMAINRLSSRGFSCNVCGDGVSYPNKFILNVLRQAGIICEPEKVFNWASNYRYDVFIPSVNMIIENHGLQHYDDRVSRGYMLDYKKQHEQDVLKKKTALENNISFYIEIDCRISDPNFIKNSLLTSHVFELLSIDDSIIDWGKCDAMSTKSMLIEACNRWNAGTKKHYRHIKYFGCF